MVSLLGLLGTVAGQAFVGSPIFVDWVFWCVFPNISLHFGVMDSPELLDKSSRFFWHGIARSEPKPKSNFKIYKKNRGP